MRAPLVAVGACAAIVVAAGCLGDPVENPTGPQDTVAYASFAVGAVHTCARTAGGRSYCWGGNGLGQLGVGDYDDRMVASRVAQGDAAYTQLALGSGHTCALVNDGSIQCWGLNDFGQLGRGVLSAPVAQPNVVTGSRQYVLVDAGGSHSCALGLSGVAWCWGWGSEGRLGNAQSGTGDFHTIPDSVLTGEQFDDISAGGFHTCAVATTGDGYCWGRNSEGQLGTGDDLNRVTPSAVAGDLVFTQISAGARHTCGLTVDGDAYCWGTNNEGQLGIGSGGARNTPGLVAGNHTWRQVSAGGNHTCGITLDGTGYCWGVNDDGQLGDGTTGGRGTPGAISGGLLFATIEAGGSEGSTGTCGRTTGGLLYCWGYGNDGMLGDGRGETSLVPIRVAGQIGG